MHADITTGIVSDFALDANTRPLEFTENRLNDLAFALTNTTLTTDNEDTVHYHHAVAIPVGIETTFTWLPRKVKTPAYNQADNAVRIVALVLPVAAQNAVKLRMTTIYPDGVTDSYVVPTIEATHLREVVHALLKATHVPARLRPSSLIATAK